MNINLRQHHFSFSRVLSCAACAMIGLAVTPALAVDVQVNANQSPWDVGVNPTYTLDSVAAPTVVSQGIDFSPGTQIAVQYVSGLIAVGDGFTSFDAQGNPGLEDDNTVYFGTVAPSFYFNPADYPAFGGELVGTFADSTGKIIGTPFSIGDSRVLTVPAGATQLELGINDNDYTDNSGTFDVTVGPVPEPGTMTLLAVGSILGLGIKRFRKSAATERR